MLRLLVGSYFMCFFPPSPPSPSNGPVLNLDPHGWRTTIGMAGVDAVGIARRVQGIGDGASSSEDGDAVGGTDAAGDDDSTFASGSQETLILAVYIVVGCGVATLVMLCIVRKVCTVLWSNVERLPFPRDEYVM